jgi:hypothetical protein
VIRFSRLLSTACDAISAGTIKKGATLAPSSCGRRSYRFFPAFLAGFFATFFAIVLIPPFVMEVRVSGDPVRRAPVRGITAALRLVARTGWREASQNHRSVIKTPPRDHKALVTPASLIQDVDYG